MQNIHRATYILLAFVLVTVTISIATIKARVLNKVPAVSKQNSELAKRRQREEDAKKQFPTADYDEQEPTEPDKKLARKATQKRYNNFGLVSRNPSPDSGGNVFIPEGLFDFPSLPVANSDVIVLGEVLDGQAHLSENKTNVYSEFTVQINTVFKSGTPVKEGSQITVERMGGYVKYPDGRRLLYQVAQTGMPRTGGRYVFFLNTIPQTQDYTILTAYELRVDGVAPLDFSKQFEDFRGCQETAFLTALSDTLSKPPTH